MDLSDERVDMDFPLCSYEPGSIKCEEHVCPRRYWSCGDGQCIRGIDRMTHMTMINRYCASMREFNYICETNPYMRLWTQPNGLCWDLAGYDDQLDVNNKNLDNEQKCTYLIRCALSQGFERDCPCDHKNCSLVMPDVCKANNLYKYPPGRLYRPYMMTYYNLNQSQRKYTPDALSFIGSIKCRGFHGKTKGEIRVDETEWREFRSFPLIDWHFCNNENIIHDYESSVQYDKLCWNESLTINKKPYAFFDICMKSRECISQYRLGDGHFDCGSKEPLFLTNNYLCSTIQKHRFRCSNQQSSCLPVRELGDRWEDCENGYDEFVDGLGESIFEIKCKQQNDDSCRFLKEYIGRNSFINITSSSSKDALKTLVIPFQSYCDTFWNLPSRFDELSEYCREWKCRHDQYQCQTGQCIEADWLCDREWDCPDASDEQAIHLNFQRSLHNQQLPDFSSIIKKCRNIYAGQKLFAKKCDITREYPCFLANTTDPHDIEQNRPCINLTQIGDGIKNCADGLDEKNVLESCDGSTLGFSFRCDNKHCLDYESLCKEESGWCESETLCYYKSKNQSCSAVNDVICLDGSCRENARCNEKFECPHGEDEYWCPGIQPEGGTKYKYRNSKRNKEKYRELLWPNFPSFIQATPIAFTERKAKQYSQSSPVIIDNMRIHTNYSDSYICNRGVAVAYNGKTSVVCFCPPSYYGYRCQYFSDRSTITTRLDLLSRPKAGHIFEFRWFKVVASLLYGERVIDFHEFDIDGDIEIKNSVKHKFYLLYSLSDEMREQKKLRHFNRTDLIKNYSYSIQFIIYGLSNNAANKLGSWVYPIYFDFLPAFRLATVLKFPVWYGNVSRDPCVNNTVCSPNSTCQPILSKEQPTFSCSCRSGFYGERCEMFEPKCLSYCSSNAECKLNGHGLLKNTTNPLCICPLHRFGPRCNLHHDECQLQPCQNSGTCYVRSDPSGQRPFSCICTNNYQGDYCEKNKFSIHINLNISGNASASVVQFYNIDSYKLQLLIQHQQVSIALPTSIQYTHNKVLAPRLAILKLYDSSTESKYYILYIQNNVTNINVTSTPKHCPHTASLPFIQKFTIGTAIFKYHLLCQNDTQLLCFHDDNYLCVCEVDRRRVDCVGLNSSIDQCDFCFSGGKCLRGDLENSNDFLCLCPRCSSGRWCEFTTFAFGFTLDSLLVNDSWIIQMIYTFLVALLFVIGIFTNICSLVTFKLPQIRRFTVGKYLYIVSFLNQLALFFLLLKFIYILGGFTKHSTISLISCKLISYLLFVFTRVTFWLISWVTCDRLHVIIFPTSTLFKKPDIAVRVSVITIVVLGCMHIPDLLYTTVAVDKCIVRFDHPFISVYNRVNTLLHYLGTFAIQTVAITLLIILVARSRMKAKGNNTTFRQTFKNMFNTKKELYVTPMIIVLSATPQAILSFSLSCSELSTWQRHILLPAYLFSYAPQILGFILFVLPSKGYRQELKSTKIGKTSVFKWILKTKNHEQIQSAIINKSMLTSAK